MSAVSPITKAARQAHIAEILARSRVRSQEELAELLARRGVRVAQATLSRDLEELGAVRLRGTGGGLVYALPGDPGGPGSRPGGLSGGMAGVLPGGLERGAHEPPQAPGAGEAHHVPGTREQPTAQQPTAQHGTGLLGQAAVSQAPGGGGPGGGGPGDAGAQGAGAQAGRGPGEGAHGGRPRNGAGGPAGALSGALHRMAADLLLSAEASANLVVLRTPAGGAQLLASAIDHAGWPSILGTVAGDDTVLVIARNPAGGEEVAGALIRLAERRPRQTWAGNVRPAGSGTGNDRPAGSGTDGDAP